MEKQSESKHRINNKYTKWLVIIALALFTVFKWPQIYHDRKNISHIKEWRLEYTKDWWWIDRWHATPWWARHLWNRVRNPESIPWSDHYGYVHYGQFQRKRQFKDGVEKKYIVRKNMTKEEQESVALAIFLEVSREFEDHQGLTDFLTGSSYDAADLFSNMVWFYRAVREYSEDEVRKYLQPVGPDSSLIVYKQHGIGKNDQIGTVVKKNKEDEFVTKYPYPFNQIRTFRKWKFYGNTGILFKDMVEIWSSEQLQFLWYTSTGFDKFAVTQPYETQVNEPNAKARLKAIHPDLYQDTKVLIQQTPTHREIIAYK